MDFFKDLTKTLTLSGDYDLLNKARRIKGFQLGDVPVKISEINMAEKRVYVNVQSIKNAESVAEEIIDRLIAKAEKKAEVTKRLLRKVIKAWDETPEHFERQERHKETYVNRKVLKYDEYFHYGIESFDKYQIGYYCSFTTGCGSATHYAREYYADHLDKIDKDMARQIKKAKSAAVKKRIVKYITANLTHALTFAEASQYISAKEVAKVKKTRRPKFPMSFSGKQLNNLLYQVYEGAYIDAEFIEFIKGESNLDISSLLDWEIEVTDEGEAHHDGQVLDYTVTFSSPDGHKYELHNAHSGMTGWNFHGEDITPA